MKSIIAQIIVCFSLVACNEMATLEKAASATGGENANTNLPTPSTGKSVFAVEIKEISKFDELTGNRVVVATAPYGDTYDTLYLINDNGTKSANEFTYFSQWTNNGTNYYSFSMATNELERIEADTNSLGYSVSGDYAIRHDYLTGNSSLYNPSTKQFTSINTFFGLDGFTNSATGELCTSLGKGYFICKNSGSSSNKILFLNAKNPGAFFSYSLDTSTFTSAGVKISNGLTGIIEFYNSAVGRYTYYFFNYQTMAMSPLNIGITQDSEYAEFFIYKNSYLSVLRKSSPATLILNLINKVTGVVQNKLTSTDPQMVLFSQPGETYIVGDDVYLRGRENYDWQRNMFLKINDSGVEQFTGAHRENYYVIEGKMTALDSGRLYSADFASGGINWTYENIIQDKLVDVACAKLGQPSGCRVDFSLIYTATYKNYIEKTPYAEGDILSVQVNDGATWPRYIIKPVSAGFEFLLAPEDAGYEYFYYFHEVEERNYSVMYDFNPVF